MRRRKKVNATSKWHTSEPQKTITPPPAAETPRQRFIQLLREESWRELTEEEKSDLEALRLLIPVEQRAQMLRGIIWDPKAQ